MHAFRSRVARHWRGQHHLHGSRGWEVADGDAPGRPPGAVPSLSAPTGVAGGPEPPKASLVGGTEKRSGEAAGAGAGGGACMPHTQNAITKQKVHACSSGQRLHGE